MILKDNKIVTQDIVMEGRKVPLREIRSKMLKDHQNYIRVYSDQHYIAEKDQMLQFLKKYNEYYLHFDALLVNEICLEIDVLMQTQNLMFWHDGSSISNHSHLMIIVSCMFDPVVYLTNDEYSEIHGKYVNVQSIVEKPYLYILARCHSDDSQLLYSSECLDDLLNLNEDIEYNNKQILDTVRAFKGDSPACQLEAGQQKNGDYFCWQCPLNAKMAPNLVCTLFQPNPSLEKRINKIKVSTTSINKIKQNNVKLYKN